MNKLIFILLAILSISSKVSPESWALIETQIRNKFTDPDWTELDSPARKLKEDSVTNRVNLVKIVLQDAEYYDINFYSYLGAGSYGIVLSGIYTDGTNRKKTIKIHFEDADDCDSGLDAFNKYQRIMATEKAKFIIEIEEPKKFNDGQHHYACAFLMEKAYDTNDLQFKDGIGNKLANTNNMIHFTVSAIEAFYRLNFQSIFYHGDVKPQNLVWVKNKFGLTEVRIIDLDLAFSPKFDYLIPDLSQAPIPKFKAPNFVVYTLRYRSPELRIFIPGGDYKNRKELEEYRENCHFDLKFKEEAYAVGKTLTEIINYTNYDTFIDKTDTRIVKILRVLNGMQTHNVNDRLSTMDAYRLLGGLLVGLEHKLHI